MADGTKIEWTDATVNYINGCTVYSPGCTNCYAMLLAGTRLKHHPTREGLTIDTKAGPVWNGVVRPSEKALLQPLSWRRPRMLFWNAHGDLFHENVPDEWIDRQFAVMALTPHHRHQVLTKRSARMRAYMVALSGLDGDQRAERLETAAIEATGDAFAIDRLYDVAWPLPNVWLGVSVEDQARADERIPDLLATPGAVRFLSCEPLLGPVDLKGWIYRGWDGDIRHARPAASISWVIAGGESGSGARPMHPDWARSLRDQCAAAGVPFLFKQWGEWQYAGDLADGGERFVKVGKKAAGRLLDGVEHSGFPA